jgi:MoaA/NifB/PqqE/SkfB family radical SAM enzyme
MKSKIITGFRADFIRIRIIFEIIILIISYSKNPLRILKVLAIINSKRKTVQGHQKVRKYIKSGNRYFFSDDTPGWPSAAFNGHFRSEIIRASGLNGVRIPFSTVFFAITSKCQMRCKHCYEWDNISGKEYLSFETLKEIIKKIKEYGAYHIQLSGGEPLERIDDLIGLTDYSREGVDLWLNTSGFGLTFERARSLKKAGLTGAEISLDHWDEDEHNSFRGNNKSFFWVREAVKNCLEAGILTSLSLCATNTFVSDKNLTKYMQLAMKWRVSFIRILEPREVGRYENKEISLSKEQVLILEEFFQKSDIPGQLPEYPIISYPGFIQRRIGCLGAGNRYLYIDSKGDIHACPFCHRSAGNAITDNIEDAVLVLKTIGCHEYITNSSD